ncbi:MAG: YdiU family protein [Candidatus Dadabacteria bacterium]|nr:YdiU family protein [Candidatus Dadabacteria bacterium]NIQ14390.1 YdiU family protein [Candidatus Dadabacteria bacterium]
MKNITELTFDNTYRNLPEDFYQIVNPTPFDNPYFIAFNSDASKLIDINLNDSNRARYLDFLSGKKIIAGEQPIALYYTGHQFGVYNKDIGDGRAILLGEIRNSSNEKWDIHLKGAGRTRYSRNFDGRAVLRSTIREYLCSEAVYSLGIPTTRALCIIGSDEEVYREKTEFGAMMIRMAQSHVRFGSFEGFHYNGQHENIKILADYVIDNHYPEIRNDGEKYKLFLFNVAKSTANLIANWQAIGFTHGVMNTDNMSIIGLTLDYGPYGFMENFNQDFTPNHSDHFGRYNYRNQPSIGYWNLQKLLQCFKIIISDKESQETLELYKNIYFDSYYKLMLKKLGLTNVKDKDKKFVDNTVKIIERYSVDYTIFFRQLSNFDKSSKSIKNKFLKRLSLLNSDFYEWFMQYKKRLEEETSTDIERKKLMDSINPKYILRNYITEEVIRKAEDKNDHSEIEKTRNIFKKPYDEQPEFDEYAKESPEWAKNLVISCSS